jgi:hypothetical protein
LNGHNTLVLAAGLEVLLDPDDVGNQEEVGRPMAGDMAAVHFELLAVSKERHAWGKGTCSLASFALSDSPSCRVKRSMDSSSSRRASANFFCV